MDIASTLKEFRSNNGLEQEDLAKLLDTTQQTISNWESGTMPRSGALKRINHLLRTYKKGEPPVPYVELSAAQSSEIGQGGRHGGVHPTMSSTMIQPEEVAPQPSRDGPLLMRNVSPTAHDAQSFFRAIMEEADARLNLRQRVPIDFQGLRLSPDLLGSGVCAEIRYFAGPFPGAIYTDNSIFQLASIRKIHKLKGEERPVYALIVCTPANSPLAPRTYNRLLTTAALHDVEVYVVHSPDQAITILEALETGNHIDAEEIITDL